MKKLAFALIASLAIVSQAALATAYTEAGDAGSLPSTAQNAGSGVTSISGSTSTNTDTEDLFKFSWDGGLFEAATNGLFGSSRSFDTMLFLFDGSGNFITANDDTSGPNGSLDSYISASLSAGDYLLGISGFSNDALNGSGSAFRFGASGVLTSWEGGGAVGSYTIGINRTVPEPAPLALLALGLGAIAVGRRGKRA